MAQASLSLFITLLIGIITLCPDFSSELRINCRGSSNCSGLYSLNKITAKVCNDVPPNNIIKPGAAFVQTTSQTIMGRQACELLRRLQDHNCKVCGSIPINTGNDVSKGQLLHSTLLEHATDKIIFM